MRQRITVENLAELSPEQQEKLRVWWKEHKAEGDHFVNIDEETGNIPTFGSGVNGSCGGYWNCECQIDDGEDPSYRPEENSLPILSIGQMIDLLQDNIRDIKWDPDEENSIQIYKDGDWGRKSYYVSLLNNDICNNLWQAVKEIL